MGKLLMSTGCLLMLLPLLVILVVILYAVWPPLGIFVGIFVVVGGFMVVAS